MEDYSLADEAYAVAVENMGELSWGVGVPTSIPFKYFDAKAMKVVHIQVRGTDIMEDVFKVFYNKLKSNAPYRPLEMARKSASTLQQRVWDLEKELLEIKQRNN